MFAGSGCASEKISLEHNKTETESEDFYHGVHTRDWVFSQSFQFSLQPLLQPASAKLVIVSTTHLAVALNNAPYFISRIRV